MSGSATAAGAGAVLGLPDRRDWASVALIASGIVLTLILIALGPEALVIEAGLAAASP